MLKVCPPFNQHIVVFTRNGAASFHARVTRANDDWL
jgi:hypothetical protein